MINIQRVVRKMLKLISAQKVAKRTKWFLRFGFLVSRCLDVVGKTETDEPGKERERY